MAMEVITTTDKDARDRMFDDLRKNGNKLEKQVVKFSGNESHPLKTGQFISSWSVAYPSTANPSPPPRRARRDREHPYHEYLIENLKEDVLT
jgi:hypothetical protein